MATATFSGTDVEARVRATVALVERRGYALSPGRLGDLCLGGALTGAEVLDVLRGPAALELSEGLVVSPAAVPRARAISSRADGHVAARAVYLASAVRFARLLGRLPFVLAVSIAGSLASGGFALSDDVDLNLVVADGSRYRAYCALNLLGYAHALAHRDKPVDGLTRRPLAPRLMTANLILERSECFPLVRSDAAMAFELLQSEPVLGADLVEEIVAANPELARHFPQLRRRPSPLAAPFPPRLPAAAAPAWLEPAARRLGRAAWRYMQWTRRQDPAALARVAFVRETMRPYTLFPEL